MKNFVVLKFCCKYLSKDTAILYGGNNLFCLVAAFLFTIFISVCTRIILNWLRVEILLNTQNIKKY